MTKLIEECYQESIKLLHTNSNQFGVLASGQIPKSGEKNYHQLFGRDTSICALGLISTKEKKGLSLAQNSLLSLAKVQSPMGQIPFSYDFTIKQANYRTPGNLDSTLWWIISCLIYIRETKDKAFIATTAHKINQAIIWLTYQDQNEDGLLEQGEGGDWADEMPSRGVVLYNNVLWFKAISLYKQIFQKEFKQINISENLIKSGINSLLWQPDGKSNTYFKKNPFITKTIIQADKSKTKMPYFLNYFNHREFGCRCDTFGNILTIICNLSSSKQKKEIINYIIKQKLNKPFPVINYYPPIKPTDKDWPSYMLYRNQNLPWQYHNGGIWPYISSLWAVALYNANQKQLAITELEKVAKTNQLNGWEFNEFLNGKTGKPMGIKKQSWNAGTFILAYNLIKNSFKI